MIEEPKVINFGCRLNIYESEAIKEIVNSPIVKESQDNLVVLNSCAVTQNAEKELKKSIRRIFKNNPESKIVVTGCAAQINPSDYAKMPEVFRVLGNNDKFNKEAYYLKNIKDINLPKASTPVKLDVKSLNQHQDHLFLKENIDSDFVNQNFEEKILVNDIMSIKETSSHLISGFENNNRAFVQIQNGCNHRCTFCIIPYGRGNSRSVAFGEIVHQIKSLVNKGYKEIVLTGVDISDYGKDLLDGLTLAKMIKRLLKLIPELPRLRVSSIDVAEIDQDFLDLLASESRLMPYLHISLQSGDDLILKRMKRRHSRSQIIDFCNLARKLRPEITFGADIIAGFPTEKEENFQNSLNLIKEVGIIFNHIFPYSIRKGTPAAKMPQIETKIKKERVKLLREAGKEQLDLFLEKQIGKKVSVILEDKNIGRCENFVSLKLNELSSNFKSGDIFEVKISKEMFQYSTV